MTKPQPTLARTVDHVDRVDYTVRFLVAVVHVSIAGKLLQMLGHPVWSTWSTLKRNVIVLDAVG